MKNIVKKANNLMSKDLIWKPLYPNNMPCNGLDGYYCMMLHQDKDGNYLGRKYTILFQHKELSLGTGQIKRNEIDRYILFEKSYIEIQGKLEHPEPADDVDLFTNDNNTLSALDVNDYGSFVYAYENLDLAKHRALVQYKAIYGYALSHLISE